MISPRLPARPLLRCLLAFTLASCILIAIGFVALVMKLHAYQRDWPPQAAGIPAQVAQQDVGPLKLEVVTYQPSTKKKSSLSAQISEVVARSTRQSTDENLDQLDSMSKQLGSVTSDESVDDLANSIQHWMGLGSRASKPKSNASKSNASSDEFDIDSAQLHDVERRGKKPGKVEFQAVLIDARGNTMQIKMTDHEGQETYALMQRIKSNPLLEKIYRQIAMPLLDNLVQSARDQMASPSSPPAAN